MPRFTVAIVAILYSHVAIAAQVCHDGPDGLICLEDQQLRENFEALEDAIADEVMAVVEEARTRGGTDTLLVDADNRFHAAIVQVVGENAWALVEDLGVIAPPLLPPLPPPILPPIPPILPPIIPPIRPLSGLQSYTSSYTSTSIHEDAGDNTDGQMLHGPPGSAATWGCTGYSTNDTCKACCMATRTLGLAPIAAWAKYCHGVIANACTALAWLCHAGCVASEAIALGALWYSADKCNDNCERSYWNDQSVDWNGVQHSSLRQAVESGEYKTCEGWVSRLEWYGVDWLALSEDYDDINGTYNCAMLIDPDNDVVEELYWGARGKRVRVVGEWPWDFRPVEYRILDINGSTPGRQIPFVGTTGIDDDGVYLVLQRTGEKLYLDGRFVFESLKVWVWGEREGNRLRIQAWNILWWDILEGWL